MGPKIDFLQKRNVGNYSIHPWFLEDFTKKLRLEFFYRRLDLDLGGGRAAGSFQPVSRRGVGEKITKY